MQVYYTCITIVHVNFAEPMLSWILDPQGTNVSSVINSKDFIERGEIYIREEMILDTLAHDLTPVKRYLTV